MRKIGHTEEPQRQCYMMLSRMEQDCKFYLGCGMRDARYSLYWKDEETHIREMLRIYESIILKPEWLGVRDILRYSGQMGVKIRFGKIRAFADDIHRSFQHVRHRNEFGEG